MEMQNQIKEYVAQYEKEVRKLADQLRNECMPQPTEELFSEFETNGNRMRYEAVYFGRRKFLSVLVLASRYSKVRRGNTGNMCRRVLGTSSTCEKKGKS